MAKAPENTAKKRRIKDPETFREKALKEASGKQELTRLQKSSSKIKKLLKKIFGPLEKPLKKVGNLKPFTWLRKPFKILGYILLPVYLRNSWKELKLVTWPTKRESRRLTYAVLVFAIIFGASIALVDFGLDKLFKTILLK